MDAVRLIAAGRHALAQSGAAMDIVGEAWQAQALTQGIGSWLAVTGPRELRSEARGLGEAGAEAAGCSTEPPCAARAARPTIRRERRS